VTRGAPAGGALVVQQVGVGEGRPAVPAELQPVTERLQCEGVQRAGFPRVLVTRMGGSPTLAGRASSPGWSGVVVERIDADKGEDSADLSWTGEAVEGMGVGQCVREHIGSAAKRSGRQPAVEDLPALILG
jgi:hypothetical protein